MASDTATDGEAEIDKEVVETKEGIRVSASIKRGTGTRDQDKLSVRAYADDMDEAQAKLETGVTMLKSEAQRLRRIQPDVGVDVE